MVNGFECVFRTPVEVDITDVAATRQMIIDMVNDEGFGNALSDLAVTREHATTGPAPRGGDIDIHCSSDFHGGGSCSVGGTIHF